MAWQIKDEWIDLAQGKHVVVFHNPDVLVPSRSSSLLSVPVEHHLMHEFKLPSCPHCGHVKRKQPQAPAIWFGEPEPEKATLPLTGVDFVQVKAQTLLDLHGHHQQLMAYRELHPRVRLGAGPKQ